MAPPIVQAFDPESLRRIHVPVGIILGDADPIAQPDTNGRVAVNLIPTAQLQVLPGGVAHYDFLSDCTPAGDAAIPACPTQRPRDATHQVAIDAALALFGRTLRADTATAPTAATTKGS